MRYLERRRRLIPLAVLALASAVFMAPTVTASVTMWSSQQDYRSGELEDLDVAAQPGNLVLARDLSLWEKHGGNPVFDPGHEGAWDESSVTSLSILMDAGVYRMWYAGCRGYACSIGTASSPDGISWSRYAGNPVLPLDPSGWDRTINNPSVIKDGGVYRMWYAAHSYNGTIEIGYATSLDGYSWTKHPDNPVLRPTEGGWDQGSVSTPAVIREGALYTMWYSGQRGDFIYRMGRATSSDGASWTKDPLGLTLSPERPWEESRLHPVQILKAEGEYELYYAAGFSTYHVGRLVSTDGVSWTREPDSPILSPGVAGSWDDGRLGIATVLHQNGERKIWFAGGANFQPLELHVGLATAPYYVATGTFVSDVYDSGANLTNWEELSWSATAPQGTALTVTARSGNSSVPDSEWSSWSSPASFSPINLELPLSRYVQIRVVFSTTHPTQTPILHDVSVSFSVFTPNTQWLPAALLIALTPIAVAVPLIYFAYRWRRGLPKSPPKPSVMPPSPSIVHCGNCGHENHLPSQFCSECGDVLPSSPG